MLISRSRLGLWFPPILPSGPVETPQGNWTLANLKGHIETNGGPVIAMTFVRNQAS